MAESAGENKVTLCVDFVSWRILGWSGLGALHRAISHLALAACAPGNRHTENFFHAIERKDWATAANFIGSDYQDQWGDDRARVLERMREGFRYVRGPRIVASNPSVQVETGRAFWTSKIMVYSTDDDVMELLDGRVNSLPAPFELEWHRLSGKPWDWKLVRASNSAFEIPADIY